MNARPILEIEDLVVRYPGTDSAAVDGVSIVVHEGETVGLVGESGSGKTTIGKAILGLERVSSGSIRYEGTDITSAGRRDRRRLGGRLRAVFQDPYSSLNPRLTVGASIVQPLRVAGVPRGECQERARLILRAVGLPEDSLDRFPRQFSGGQRQRIAIARALITDPSLVICDEPVSALDLSTQAQVLNLLADLRDRRGLSYLFIAHDIAVVAFLAQRVVVLYRGQIMEEGPSFDVTGVPRHPFTQALVSASPVPRPIEQAERRRRREAMGVRSAGMVESSPTGCPFASRCPLATGRCRTERPELRDVGTARVACHYATAEGAFEITAEDLVG